MAKTIAPMPRLGRTQDLLLWAKALVEAIQSFMLQQTLTSPDGNTWKLVVDNNGVLSTKKITDA